ncbi:MAG: hypothetical protein NTZ85_02700 [Bacteroidia bacterium]|nr:hypothetical protein [Bacteroidia bacterium]
MCFSAGASFAGGAVISAIGIATVRIARKPSQTLFASVPLLFGLQQFAEGVVWITLRSGGHVQLQYAAAYIFLIMALVVWPVMLPFSVMIMEKLKKKKKILIVFLIIGALLSAYYAYCMLSYPVAPQIKSHHIVYKGDFPKSLVTPAFIVYLVTTLPPLFISSVRKTYIMGVLIALSCLVSGIFFKETHTSVWCFFAALISGVIYWIISLSTKEKTNGREASA